jgi:Rrf2 family protein
MLSSRTKYGIHSLIYLAHRFGHGLVAIRDISEAERIPRKFLEAILVDLKGDGILMSRPGPSGGYQLRISPEKLSLGRIIRILEGPLALTPCVSVNNYSTCVDCRSEDVCSLKIAMKKVRDATAEILDQWTLQDLAQKENQLKSQISAHSFDI